jgi:Peptidase family S41
VPVTRSTRSGLAALTTLLLVACQVNPATTAAPSAGGRTPAALTTAPMTGAPRATPSAVDLARADLDRLLVELEKIHPEPFHGIDRAVWVAAKDDLAARLPTLTIDEAVVELQRLVALLSREGRDGHQFAFRTNAAEGPILPIRIHEFEEGVFITAADDDSSLIGARIDAIEGRPIADVLAAIEPLVPRDGPATVPLFRPLFLLRTTVLRGLGIVEEGGVAISVTLPDGSTQDVELTGEPIDDYLDWATIFGFIRLPPHAGLDYLHQMDAPIFSWRFLEDSRSVYVRYTLVQGAQAADLISLRERAAMSDVERVIVDLRQNPGGDNHNIRRILEVLQDPAVDRTGRLFVLTDRVTFSAASNFTTQIEQSTGAIFVGEPMGGGLNFWNDVDQVSLPNWPAAMQVGISTRYWQFATPDDPRLTIEPDIPVALRAADYFAGVDAALEALLAAE